MGSGLLGDGTDKMNIHISLGAIQQMRRLGRQGAHPQQVHESFSSMLLACFPAILVFCCSAKLQTMLSNLVDQFQDHVRTCRNEKREVT